MLLKDGKMTPTIHLEIGQPTGMLLPTEVATNLKLPHEDGKTALIAMFESRTEASIHRSS
jgi:hypothetical protein